MNREEFENELREAGFEMDDAYESWVRPADDYNGVVRLSSLAIEQVGDLYGSDVFRVLLAQTLGEIRTPSAVDRLGDVVRTDDGAGEVLSLVLGAP